MGRYRFMKGRPVVTEDPELIKYCTINPDFKMEVLEVEEEPKKAAPKATVAPKQPAPPPKAVGAKDEKPAAAKQKLKPEPVSDDDMDIDAPEAEESKSSPSSKLARKKRTETAHETN